MPTLDNLLAGQITIGGTTHQLQEIRYGSGLQLLWPTALMATLTPSWRYGGQYNLTNIPASGGSATAIWTLTVVQNGTVVQTATVTPTSYNISYPQGQTETNFATYNLSTGNFEAPSRGTNGYTSGSSYPTGYLSAPDRYCTLNVFYSGTYNGVSYIATGNAAMTQKENNGSYASTSYSSITASLNRYYSSGSPAPASAASATASASATAINYFSWSSGESAYYTESLSTASFSFSSNQTWATVSGTGISIATRGTTLGETQRTATIHAAITASPTDYAEVTLYQDINVIVHTDYGSDTVTSFTLNNITDTIPISGGTIYLSGVWSGHHDADTYTWSSGATSGGESSTVTNQPTTPTSYKVGSGSTTTYDSSTGCVISGTNYHNLTTKSYTITGYFGGKSSSKTATQEADYYDTTVLYSDFVVNITTSGSYTAGPSTSSVTYTWTATHKERTAYYWHSDGTFHHESAKSSPISDTITSSNVSTSTASSTAPGASGRFHRSGNVISHDAMVYNEGSDTIVVTVTHPRDSSTTTSNTLGATNTKTQVSAGSRSVSSFSLNSVSTLAVTATSFSVTGTATIAITEAEYSWSSGAPNTGGGTTTQTVSNTAPTTTYYKLSTAGSYSSVAGGTVNLGSSNAHNTSQRAYNVYGSYTDSVSGTSADSSANPIIVTQNADSTYAGDYWANLTRSNNTVWAGGGNATLTASAGHSVYWSSDNALYGTESDSVTVERRSGGTGYTLTDNGNGTYLVEHRNMGTTATTDAVAYRAKNGSSSSAVSSNIDFSVVNKVESTYLDADWTISGIPISGMGGTATITVGSPARVSVYTSTAELRSARTASTILNRNYISLSDTTNFTYSYSSGSTATITARRNPSTSTGRTCVITTTNGGYTDTLTATQDHINHEVSYETASGTINGFIKNTDSSRSHSFTYYVVYDGTVTVPETTSTWSAGEKRQVGGGQASGHILSVVVTKEDGVSEVT